ncbi:MAG: hypothetical protein V7756_05205 [Halopseudomonas sp.]|uniref:hypothetical protein n=1 Tax=Halopseudomonas sp. TaxID=2901191 RepID=UPI0030032488
MSKPVFQSRVDFLGLPADQGRVFVCPQTSAITDLSCLRVLHSGVDTVRQLYRGKLRAGILSMFESTKLLTFAGYQWFPGRVGRDSGYQYRLQNNDLGLILLIKNFNVSEYDNGPHLKIEASPHLIGSIAPTELQTLMNTLAIDILEDLQPNQCAVHLAVDLQGWVPPSDFIDRMHCRSRRTRDTSGISQINWDSESTVYGRGQSFLFGSASSVQLAIYNKTLQARAIDKLDYWQRVWRQSDNPFDDADPLNYDPLQDVWRIEIRYHHSVVNQFASGSVDLSTSAPIDTSMFNQIAPHLDGLWRYGLTAFKMLDVNQARSTKVYSAIWTLLSQDVYFFSSTALHDTDYRRAYKTAGGFSGKNVELFMGNMVSLLARERIGAKKAFDRLKEWECWPVISEHFKNKGKSERDVYRWLRDKLAERTIRYGVAV